MLNSVHKITVTYYGEITFEPILNPEFDVDHDFEVKNGPTIQQSGGKALET